MSIRLYADEFRCAIYEEAPGGGEADDPNAPMNRPVVNPLGWLSNLRFHSDLDYYEIVGRVLNLPIVHQAVATITRNAGGTGESGASVVSIAGQSVHLTHSLLTHNLGYPPKFFALYNGQLMSAGVPIQNAGVGGVRIVTAYATATEIRLDEFASSGSSNLPALNATYSAIAFRTPAKDPALPMLDIYPGQAIFGQGKFRAGEPHLRNPGPGDTLWPIATARTAAIRNGSFRMYFANGSYSDFGPFNGSLPAPSVINMAAGI